jgi:DNA uptake protein ComE-like DNA-binding protein
MSQLPAQADANDAQSELPRATVTALAQTTTASQRIPGTRLVTLLVLALLAFAAWQKLHRPVMVPMSEPARSAKAARNNSDVVASQLPSTPSALALPDTRIDINGASAAELSLLPGIGPKLADAIVADRQSNGPFKLVEDLDRV